jgi:16S rRNA (guanine527-N7)-methyltransferase
MSPLSSKEIQEFQGSLVGLGFSVEEAAAAASRMIQYMELTLEWNNKVNLTSITNINDFIHKHFIDSLACVGSKEFKEASRIIDIGTGGGFPGVPLAILFPEKNFVLLDSLLKRLKIVAEMATDIGLENIEIVHGRAEDLAKNPAYREKFDLVVSRAVANMSTLAELCLPFARVGGSFIAYKGGDCKQEIISADKAIRTMGGSLDRLEKTELESLDAHHTMLYIHKVEATPPFYPRKAGTPAKYPFQ